MNLPNKCSSKSCCMGNTVHNTRNRWYFNLADTTKLRQGFRKSWWLLKDILILVKQTNIILLNSLGEGQLLGTPHDINMYLERVYLLQNPVCIKKPVTMTLFSSSVVQRGKYLVVATTRPTIWHCQKHHQPTLNKDNFWERIYGVSQYVRPHRVRYSQ